MPSLSHTRLEMLVAVWNIQSTLHFSSEGIVNLVAFLQPFKELFARMNRGMLYYITMWRE